MSRDEERRARDPVLWHQVRSRLARIKMALAVRRVDELLSSPNMIEQTLLGQRPRHDRKEVKQ